MREFYITMEEIVWIGSIDHLQEKGGENGGYKP